MLNKFNKYLNKKKTKFQIRKKFKNNNNKIKKY